MNAKRIGNWFVFGQFAILIVLFLIPGGTAWQNAPGLSALSNAVLVVGWVILLIAGFNLGRSLTANPVPLQNAQLKTNGLYALVRHPIYFGLTLIAVAMALGKHSLLGVLLLLALVVLLYFKSRFEEKLLRAKFPEYAEYAKKVGRFIPFVGRDHK